MRIALISTLSRPVPPPAEGSVELLVHYLADSLVERGHDVTLFALPGSRTKARLVSVVDSSYVNDPEKWDWQLYEAYQVREAFTRWREFDVINCHAYYFGMLFADLVPVPSIHSIHIEPGPDYRFLAERTKNRHLHFCSKYQARDFQDLPDVHIIPHGISTENPGMARDGAGKYLAWIGRFHPDKGVLDAIEVARRAGMPLKMAAPENDYYREVVRPLVDGSTVEYVGEISGLRKAEFFANAAALLYPVQRGEPFGLVLIEAMAAGLPVVACPAGAVPEIIDEGVTGYFGQSVEELVAAVPKAVELGRERIRGEARAKFSHQVMTERMEQLMSEVTQVHAK